MNLSYSSDIFCLPFVLFDFAHVCNAGKKTLREKKGQEIIVVGIIRASCNDDGVFYCLKIMLI